MNCHPICPPATCRLRCFTPAGFVLGTVMGTLVVLSVIFICREDRCWWLLCCRPRPHRPHSLPGQAGEICRLNMRLCCYCWYLCYCGLFAMKRSPQTTLQAARTDHHVLCACCIFILYTAAGQVLACGRPRRVPGRAGGLWGPSTGLLAPPVLGDMLRPCTRIF